MGHKTLLGQLRAVGMTVLIWQVRKSSWIMPKTWQPSKGSIHVLQCFLGAPQNPKVPSGFPHSCPMCIRGILGFQHSRFFFLTPQASKLSVLPWSMHSLYLSSFGISPEKHPMASLFWHVRSLQALWVPCALNRICCHLEIPMTHPLLSVSPSCPHVPEWPAYHLHALNYQFLLNLFSRNSKWPSLQKAWPWPNCSHLTVVTLVEQKAHRPGNQILVLPLAGITWANHSTFWDQFLNHKRWALDRISWKLIPCTKNVLCKKISKEH